MQVQNISQDGSYIGKEAIRNEQVSDGYDTVDAVSENQAINRSAERYEPLNLSTKVSASEDVIICTSETLIQHSTPRHVNVDSSKTPDAAFGSARQMKSAMTEQYVEKNSPMAVAFESAIASGEYQIKSNEDRNSKKYTPRTLSDEIKQDEKPNANAGNLSDTQATVFTPDAGPIYMPTSAERHPPIRSTQMRSECQNCPRSPGGSLVLLQRRKSQNYVDSAARYSPSPAKGSPSPVKDKVLQLEQRKSPAKEEIATPPGMPSRTKVKQLAAQLVAAVQGTPPKHLPKLDVKAAQALQLETHDIKAAQALHFEPSKFESTLNLQVTSPRFQQKAVCVVEVSSPVKVLKPQCLTDRSGDCVDEQVRIVCKSNKKYRNKEQTLPECSFVFSEPVPVEINDDDNSENESHQTVEEELTVKAVASEANNSLVSSINDQSVVSDTTFDDSRNSFEKPAFTSCVSRVEALTDESSLPEDDWGQESGIENLSDLKINVSGSKLSPVIEDSDLNEEIAAFDVTAINKGGTAESCNEASGIKNHNFLLCMKC